MFHWLIYLWILAPLRRQVLASSEALVEEAVSRMPALLEKHDLQLEDITAEIPWPHTLLPQQRANITCTRGNLSTLTALSLKKEVLKTSGDDGEALLLAELDIPNLRYRYSCTLRTLVIRHYVFRAIVSGSVFRPKVGSQLHPLPSTSSGCSLTVKRLSMDKAYVTFDDKNPVLNGLMFRHRIGWFASAILKEIKDQVNQEFQKVVGRDIQLSHSC